MISKNLFYTTSAFFLVLQMSLTFPGLAMDKNTGEEKKFTTAHPISPNETPNTSTGSFSISSSHSSSSSEPTSPSSSSVLIPNTGLYDVGLASIDDEDARGGSKIRRVIPAPQPKDVPCIFPSYEREKLEQEIRNILARINKEMIIANQQHLLDIANQSKMKASEVNK